MIDLPNLLIAGVSHGGTTSVFSYLASHPEICTSTVKETHYFYPILNGFALEPIEKYQKYFLCHNNESYMMEAGPGYLYGGRELACKVKEVLGQVRLIFILREPVSRLYSYFKYCNKVMQVSDISFSDFVQLIDNQPHKRESGTSTKNRAATRIRRDSRNFETSANGFYASFLTEWYTVFAEDSIKVVFFDDLRKNPADLINSIYRWLSINISLHATNDFTIENKGFYYKNKNIHKVAVNLNEKFESFFRRYPSIKQFVRNMYMLNATKNPFPLDQETESFLKKLYAPHNRQLFSLLTAKGHSSDRMPGWLTEGSV